MNDDAPAPAWAQVQGLRTSIPVQITDAQMQWLERESARQGLEPEELLTLIVTPEFQALVKAYDTVHKPLDGQHC